MSHSINSEFKFDPKEPSMPISYPIKTLKELESGSYFESFHYPFNKASVPIESGYSEPLPNRRRILVCHDMAGGYLDDKWVQGGTNAEAYAIWHWHLIDVFVYFSHNLVTLPPPSWTNTAHRHGVKVLGTFITEGDEGTTVCNELLSTKESAQMYAKHLAELAVTLGFDGWLLNMEVSLKPEQISNLKEFVNHLSLTTHSSVPGSLVIWYDSVTINGDLWWQNELNEHNKPFFDICDGIFTNYSWQEDYPRRSAAVAGDRKFDVYMGIDVFGRNTYGGGMWNTNVALDVIRKDDVSAAIFAPGWVYETKQAPDFETAQNRWWSLVEKSWGIVRKYLGTLPFYTNFDQGRGYHISVDGDQVSDATWCNISSQGVQPLLEFADSTANSIQPLVDLKEASYSGGGNITFKGSLEKDNYLKRRIFQGEFTLSELPIHFFYSVKSDSNSSLGLVLEFTSTINKAMSILLTSHGMDHLSSGFSKVVPTSEHKGNAPGWVIHEGTIEMNGYILTGIHALCYRPNAPFKELKSRPFGPDYTVPSSTDYSAVLGHITVKTSNYKPDFPVSTSWLVDGEYINWKSGPQDSRILSVKISWELKEGKNFAFPHYNVYVEKIPKLAGGNSGTTIEHVQEYLGVAHVNCFYVSELKVPASISNLKFIIQVCSFDGTNQNLEDCPYYQLEIKEFKFDPKEPSMPISYPIKTLKELESRSYFESFHYPFNKASVPIESGYSEPLPNRRRILVCHDMAGGYLDDKWVQGGTNAEAYAIWHWHLIDVFVYFSHNLVTLPPPSWTNTAHRHGVKVLGTFITEWNEGKAACDKLLSTKESAQMYAKHLAELAANLGFDGWLLNIEVTLKPEQISNLKEYDSVTINGDLWWQNELNEYNKSFFDICDGIFTNYSWQEDYPWRSASVAGDRKFDVYMGIDVFGRGTYGGGQWNTNVALDVIRKADVSAAIFAPGWVYETKQAPDFKTAQNRWWGLVEKSWGIVRKYHGTLPFYTNFDQGHGYHISVDGDQVSDATWCNISSQSIQPLLEFADSTANSIQLIVDLKEASYSGGGNITFKGSLGEGTYLKRRIFQGQSILAKLPIHFIYSVKSDSNSSLGLVLDFTSTINKTTPVLLTSHGMDHLSSEFSKVVLTSEHKGNAPGWVIHEGTIEMNGYILTGIHALCYRPNAPSMKSRPFGPDHAVPSSTDYFAVLGHITVKTSNYKPDFPVSTSWLVNGECINWKSGPQDSRILSVKISWKLKNGQNLAFSHHNVYVEKPPKLAYGNPSTTLEPVQEYLGVAHVNCFYVSELKVPASTSSLKFIIQI
ncbi:Cytosolic endo-beta-N-acetylglucosaminidase 1 [Glycine max]|nr:Cytosolic endo-beta-N-acetylglucosaminidase 1 [Glycine max]